MANKETKKKETPVAAEAATTDLASKAGRVKRTKAPAHKPATRAASKEEVVAAATPAVAAAPVNVAAPVVNPAAERAEIANLAYYFWLERGQVDGFADADWLRAEEAVRARRA